MSLKEVYNTKINMLKLDPEKLCNILKTSNDNLTVINNDDRTLYVEGIEPQNNIFDNAITTWAGAINTPSMVYDIMPLGSNSCVLRI